jgi:hypothetical protein
MDFLLAVLCGLIPGAGKAVHKRKKEGETHMIRPAVEDELAIRELYARYSWALDTGDTDGYCALFTPDAEASEETASGELEVRKGRDEIRKLVLKFHQRPDFPGHQHQMDQLLFEPDPKGRPDHWQVRSYAWATINRPPEPPRLHWCGHIRDVVAKVGSEWLIAEKDIMGWTGKVLEGFAAHR